MHGCQWWVGEAAEERMHAGVDEERRYTYQLDLGMLQHAQLSAFDVGQAVLLKVVGGHAAAVARLR